MSDVTNDDWYFFAGTPFTLTTPSEALIDHVQILLDFDAKKYTLKLCVHYMGR